MQKHLMTSTFIFYVYKKFLEITTKTFCTFLFSNSWKPDAKLFSRNGGTILHNLSRYYSVFENCRTQTNDNTRWRYSFRSKKCYKVIKKWLSSEPNCYFCYQKLFIHHIEQFHLEITSRNNLNFLSSWF